MAWSEREAILAGELICIRQIGTRFLPDESYKIVYNGAFYVVEVGGVELNFSTLCRFYNDCFILPKIQLEND